MKTRMVCSRMVVLLTPAYFPLVDLCHVALLCPSKKDGVARVQVVIRILAVHQARIVRVSPKLQRYYME